MKKNILTLLSVSLCFTVFTVYALELQFNDIVLEINKKNNSKHYIILQTMMNKIGYSCGVNVASDRCNKILGLAYDSYASRDSTNVVMTDSFKEKIIKDNILYNQITQEEVDISKKLKPYIPEYQSLQEWARYDVNQEALAEFIKKGGDGSHIAFPIPKTPRPDGTFSLPMVLKKEITVVATSTQVATTSQLAATATLQVPITISESVAPIVKEMPSKKNSNNILSNFFTQILGWFKRH